MACDARKLASSGRVRRSKRSAFAWSSADFDILTRVGCRCRGRSQAQSSWHAQHFCTVRCRFCGRRSTFARSGVDFASGAALSHGRAALSESQVQHFRRIISRLRGKRSTFAKSGGHAQSNFARSIDRLVVREGGRGLIQYAED